MGRFFLYNQDFNKNIDQKKIDNYINFLLLKLDKI